MIKISIAEQRLYLYKANRLIKTYVVSTAKNGPGQLLGSECTPCGRHIIAEKIGGGCAINSVFIGRLHAGMIYSDELNSKYPERDWILTRILWLSGTEEGKNKGGSVDTFSRYIYIHGSPFGSKIGEPNSHGCVRMFNDDIMNLFELVKVGEEVFIYDK